MFNFFSKSSIGIDISDRSIEAVSLGGRAESPRLLAMGRAILEPGVLENGRIMDKEKLKNSLLGLIKKPNFGSIRTKKIVFSVPEPKIFIHILKMPEDLKEQDKIEFIRFQASQTFPYLLKDLYFDFKISGTEVLISAASKAIVNDFLEVFKSCGLQTLAVGIESENLARSLIFNQNAGDPVVIADVGTKTTGFSIFDKGELKISISIEVAGDKFTQSISEKMGVSPKDAESLKKEIGLNPEPKQGKVFLILQNEIQEIIQEIKKIRLYFKEAEGREIRKIILAGGSSTLPYFAEYLNDNLEIPVVIGDPWVRINIDILKRKEYLKEALGINPIFYAAAIGSALKGLTNNPEKDGINLIKNT